MSKIKSGIKKKAGRHLIKIEWSEFDKLCAIQCSLREIASWFDCSEDTIERAVLRERQMKFAEYFEQKRGKGKIALRRKQYEVAMSGNVALLIWLGKQYLGQSDKQEIEHNHEKEIKIEYYEKTIDQEN